MNWESRAGSENIHIRTIDKQMGVSENGGYLQMIHFNRVFHYPPTPRLFRGGGEKNGVGDT